MAKAAVENRAQAQRPVRAPKRGERRSQRALAAAAAAGVAGLAAIALVALSFRGGDEDGAALPRTSDYHSLLVSGRGSGRLTLGTHQGLFRSDDGGRSWRQAALAGQDAMNLARPDAATLWAAGHNVLARSGDGGASWEDVRPEALPSLDVHGFAVDPRDGRRLFAAIAGEGIYRSTDAGRSFALATDDVGAGVMALAALPDGRLLAGDMERQELLESDDGGRSWRPLLQTQVMGLAVNPGEPDTILASGSRVLRSTDGGKDWAPVLDTPAGSGPIAWSQGDPAVAYVVGLDRSLYRSDDTGETWSAVVSGEGS